MKISKQIHYNLALTAPDVEYLENLAIVLPYAQAGVVCHVLSTWAYRAMREQEVIAFKQLLEILMLHRPDDTICELWKALREEMPWPN